MEQKVTSSFFTFQEPKFAGVSQEMFHAVKKRYSPEVISSVKEIAEAYMEEVTSITKYVLPELRTVLVAREEIIIIH